MGKENQEIGANQDDVKTSLAKINCALDEITKSLRKVSSRVDFCEKSNEELRARCGQQDTFSGFASLSPPEGGITGHRPGENPLSVNIQGDFRALKDSYQKGSTQL